MKERAERQQQSHVLKPQYAPCLAATWKKRRTLVMVESLLKSSPHHSPIASETPYTRAIPED